MGLPAFAFDNNFLPDRGNIFVDTCGPTWVPNVNDKCIPQQIRRLRDFNDIFERRGYVFSTPKILKEIRDSAAHFFNERDRMEKRMGNRLKKFGANANVSGFLRAIRENREAYEAKTRLIDILEEVCYDENSYDEEFGYSEIFDFYGKFGIQDADRELVSAATFSGSESGILTADTGIMSAYRQGLSEFGRDGVICNSMDSEVQFVRGSRKRYYSLN